MMQQTRIHHGFVTGGRTGCGLTMDEVPNTQASIYFAAVTCADCIMARFPTLRAVLDLLRPLVELEPGGDAVAYLETNVNELNYAAGSLLEELGIGV